jgi:hypothetical protein
MPRNLLRAAILACLTVAACALPGALLAQEQLSQRELDVWGRFGAGSWTQARIVTETLDESGHVTSRISTDVRSTLTKVLDRGATVRIMVNVEAGGRRFETAPQTVQHGYYGERPEQYVEVKDLGPATVTVDGRDYPVHWREASFQRDGQKTVTKLCQCDAQAPFVLRRQTQVIDPANPAVERQETEEVLAVDMPYRVGAEIKPVSFERSTQKTAQGSTVTVDVTSVEVPGGLVNRTIKELDSQGHLVRRRTVELVDFSAVTDDDVPQWRSRRWRRRHQRQMDYAP